MQTIYRLVELTPEIIDSLDNDTEYYFVTWNGLPRTGTKILLSQNEGIKSMFLPSVILTDEERVNGVEAELCGKIYDQRKEIESLKKQQQEWIAEFDDFCEIMNNQLSKKKEYLINSL